jgi:hypothetical protein
VIAIDPEDWTFVQAAKRILLRVSPDLYRGSMSLAIELHNVLRIKVVATYDEIEVRL